MRSLILAAAALLAGCSAPPPEIPKGAGGCSCESKICVCPHCKGGAGNCPCKLVEKPK